MPLYRFRAPGDAAEPAPSPDADTGIRTSLTLSQLDEATCRGVRISQRGIRRYRTIEEAEADRYRYALEQLRRADQTRPG